MVADYMARKETESTRFHITLAYMIPLVEVRLNPGNQAQKGVRVVVGKFDSGE